MKHCVPSFGSKGSYACFSLLLFDELLPCACVYFRKDIHEVDRCSRPSIRFVYTSMAPYKLINRRIFATQ